MGLLDLNGIINCIKPQGLTSQDCIKLIKRFGPRKMKIGHGGTLDPFASGVLPIGINRGTKALQGFLEGDKEYRAYVSSGYTTHSLDLEGNLKAVDKSHKIGFAQLIDSSFYAQFPGSYLQRTPMFSARRVKGKRLYSIARKMETQKQEQELDLESLPQRQVQIHKVELLDSNENGFEFVIQCSKGTYVRQFVQDWSEDIGVYCTLSSLERTSVAHLKIQNSISLSDLFALLWKEKLGQNCNDNLESLKELSWFHGVNL